MELPKAGSTYTEERRGIAAVQGYAAANAQIWRETDTGDVGIDGHLEFVTDDGFATGRLVAVQVKSGKSYFAHATNHGWKYYIEDRHRHYWELFPIPVILVLHNSVNNLSYWVDARQSLRIPRDERAYIEVSSDHVLQNTGPKDLFESAGILKQKFIQDVREILSTLVSTRSANSGFPLTYFDLFVFGLTNICRSIYYGMDLVVNIVDCNLALNKSVVGAGFGQSEHDFVFGFVQFLLAQNLAHIDYADCLIDWVERSMHPHVVAPLTSRGRTLVALIGAEENRLIAAGQLPGQGLLRVAQEGLFEMNIMTFGQRFPRVREFQDKLATESCDI